MPKPARSYEERTVIAQQVFSEMRQGLSAYKACLKVGVPQGTFNGWLNEDRALA